MCELKARRPNRGRPTEPLLDRICKLMPQPVSQDAKAKIEKVVECTDAKRSADKWLRGSFEEIKSKLRQSGNLCRAYREIADELGREQQTVRRLLNPAAKERSRRQCQRLDRDPGELDAEVSPTGPPSEPPAADRTSEPGRKIKFPQDWLSLDEFQTRAAEEAKLYLPACDGAAHPEAAEFLAKIAKRLHVSTGELAMAMAAAASETSSWPSQ